MSSSRRSESCTATWLPGSRRAPNLDFVFRTPLATARTLPLCSVTSTMMRSASPSLYVRRTMPWSRYSATRPRPPISSRGRVDAAEATFAVLVLADRGHEVLLAEVGPQDVGED